MTYSQPRPRPTLPVPGNGIFRPETKPPKRRSRRTPLSAETTSPATMPANGGLFVPRQEISVFARMRGGPGRIRTSNQTVMSLTSIPFESRAVVSPVFGC
jgi:hypothetical protein